MRAADGDRAQASLPVLAIALLILSSVTVMSLAVADGVLASADRDPTERHVAASLADRLVAAGGPVAVRENVLGRSKLASLDAEALGTRFPVVDDEAVRLTVGGRAIVNDPNARGGTTIRRLVIVRRTERRSITPPFAGRTAVTLPRRAGSATLSLDAPNGTEIRSVRANGRVLRYDLGGLDGRYDLDLSRFETVRLRFVGPGPLFRGNVTISYPVERTTRATLAVTVDG